MSSLRDFQSEFLRRDLKNSLTGIAAYLKQYQKYFDDNLSNVRIDVDQVIQDNAEFRESVRQLMVGQYIASSKEGENMNETIAELKTKVSGIETTVNGINVNVGKLETEMRLRFDAVNDTMKQILAKLDEKPGKDYIQKEIQAPVATINTQLVGVNKEIEVLKTKSTDSVTNRKFWIGIAVSSVAALVAIYKIVVG